MTIRQIAISTAEFLRLDDVKDELFEEDIEDFATGDVATILKCARLAVHRVCHDIPTVCESTVTMSGSQDLLVSLAANAVVSVRDAHGVKVPFSFDARGLKLPAQGSYTVKYRAADVMPDSIDESFIPAMSDLTALTFFAAGSYCIFVGRTSEASEWLSRYEDAVSEVRIGRRAKIPPRAFL